MSLNLIQLTKKSGSLIECVTINNTSGNGAECEINTKTSGNDNERVTVDNTSGNGM